MLQAFFFVVASLSSQADGDGVAGLLHAAGAGPGRGERQPDDGGQLDGGPRGGQGHRVQRQQGRGRRGQGWGARKVTENLLKQVPFRLGRPVLLGNMTFTWKAPPEDVGPLTVRASVAYNEAYTFVNSRPVRFGAFPVRRYRSRARIWSIAHLLFRTAIRGPKGRLKYATVLRVAKHRSNTKPCFAAQSAVNTTYVFCSANCRRN